MSYNSNYPGAKVQKILERAEMPVVEVPGTSVALTANKFAILTTMQTSTLTVTLNAVEDDTVYNEYMMQFTTGSTAPTVNFPSSVVWVETPTIEANKTYQISILNGSAVALEYETPLFPLELVVGDNGNIGVLLYNYALEDYIDTGFTIPINSGEITISGEYCTSIIVDSMAITYEKKITLLTPNHNNDASNCYYLYDSGVLELFED